MPMGARVRTVALFCGEALTPEAKPDSRLSAPSDLQVPSPPPSPRLEDLSFSPSALDLFIS